MSAKQFCILRVVQVRWGYAASGQHEHMTDLEREMLKRDCSNGSDGFEKLAWAMRAMNELNLGIPMDADVFQYISDGSHTSSAEMSGLLDAMMVEINITEDNLDGMYRHVRMVREDPIEEEQLSNAIKAAKQTTAAIASK